MGRGGGEEQTQAVNEIEKKKIAMGTEMNWEDFV